MTLVVPVDGGEATSELKNTNQLWNFAVKCPALAVWQFDVKDKDSFPIASSDGNTGPITGPTAVPVERRCAGFYLTIKNATAGTYEIRANVD